MAPNTTNIAIIRGPVAIANLLITHPEYLYWRADWEKIRDCIWGQKEVKRKGSLYLPKLRKSDPQDYAEYLERAVFYNMVAQTQNGMLGQIFRRDPKIDNFPASMVNKLKSICKDSTGIINFTKTAISEQIAMGRFGVLADLPDKESAVPAPYLIGYTAENILDWRFEDVDGRYILTRVLLREFVRKRDSRYFSPYTYDSIYTELLLTQEDENAPLVYEVNKYFDQAPSVATDERLPTSLGAAKANLSRKSPFVDGVPGPEAVLTTPFFSAQPKIRGQTLDYIPFVFFGAFSNSPDVEKPPLLDIADLNLSHYRSYAELEHGRFYVAMPVYYAPGRDDEGAADYHIGPNIVWEVPEGEKPGLLEFTGQGLKAIENALTEKEAQIAAIGGRLMGGSRQRGSESDNQSTVRQANEFSLLLNVIQNCETGMTLALRYWLAFADIDLVDTIDLQMLINTDFLSPSIGARELRAIQLMYEGGLVPVDALYEYLRKAEVIPASMELADFIERLSHGDFFPGQPDVQAMRRGYSSRQQELDQDRLDTEEDFQRQELDLQQQQVDLEAEAAEANAASAAAAPPTVPKPAIKASSVSSPGLSPGPKGTAKPGTQAGKKPAGDTKQSTVLNNTKK